MLLRVCCCLQSCESPRVVNGVLYRMKTKTHGMMYVFPVRLSTTDSALLSARDSVGLPMVSDSRELGYGIRDIKLKLSSSWPVTFYFCLKAPVEFVVTLS